jgi:RNA polymerase sigma factor (sigma-70 family)
MLDLSPEKLQALCRAAVTRCYKVVDPAVDTEDLIQSVCLRVWENRSKYDSARGLPRDWIAAIARNIVRDCLSRAIRRHEIMGDFRDDLAHQGRQPSEVDLVDARLDADDAACRLERRELKRKSRITREMTGYFDRRGIL